MFYGEPSIKGKDGKMWRCVAHTMHGLVVETMVDSELVRGLVSPYDVRAYRDGKLRDVRVYGLVMSAVALAEIGR